MIYYVYGGIYFSRRTKTRDKIDIRPYLLFYMVEKWHSIKPCYIQIHIFSTAHNAHSWKLYDIWEAYN